MADTKETAVNPGADAVEKNISKKDKSGAYFFDGVNFIPEKVAAMPVDVFVEQSKGETFKNERNQTEKLKALHAEATRITKALK